MPLFKIVKWTSVRWSLAVAMLLAIGAVSLYAFEYKLASSAILWTADKSVLEQLTLLSERPPDLLPFMVSSRMAHRPPVITQVGLFDRSGALLVGNIRSIPHNMKLNGEIDVRELLEGDSDGGAQPTVARVAGRRLSNGRTLLVARNVADIRDIRGSFSVALLIGVVPAILVSIASGLFVGRRTRHRLDEMNRRAERIISGQLELRLPTSDAADGVNELAVTVNRILNKTEELVTALKGVGEDIAHDLRTPLTWIRARLERAREQAGEQEPLRSMIDQTITGLDHTLGAISSLLRIAEIEQVRRQSSFTQCDLSQIVRETVENFRPVAEDKRIEIGWQGPERSLIRGDRDLLVEAIVNLVDNALKFSITGGSVLLTVGGQPSDIVLKIVDSGPGIAPEERELVLRRFYRSDKSRSAEGSGLGLSLVAAVAKLHGLSLEIGDNAPGCVIELRRVKAAARLAEAVE